MPRYTRLHGVVNSRRRGGHDLWRPRLKTPGICASVPDNSLRSLLLARFILHAKSSAYMPDSDVVFGREQVQQRVARKRTYFISGCQVASAADRSSSRPRQTRHATAASATATAGRRRYCGCCCCCRRCGCGCCRCCCIASFVIKN